jgi:hypothetical protein
MRLILGGIAAVVTGIASGLLLSRAVWARHITAEIETLFAAARPANPPVLTETELDGLPDPVRQWLRSSGAVGRPRPSTVRLRYSGQFRLSETSAWMRYSSQSYYTTNPPALVWAAEMRMFGAVPIVGRDRYSGGEGDIRMKLLSLFRVAEKSGGSLNQGSLLRYLGETVWFPAAAVAPFIVWQAKSPDSAVATMTYRDVTASLTFFFDSQGRVVRQEATDRYNDARGRPEHWSIPITAYGTFDGMEVPTEGEGVWNYETGDFPYIRWHVTDLELDRPRPY